MFALPVTALHANTSPRFVPNADPGDRQKTSPAISTQLLAPQAFLLILVTEVQSPPYRKIWRHPMHSFPGCTALTSTRRIDDTVTHSHLPRLAAECPFINLAKIAPRYSRKISYCNRISPPARPFRAPVSPFTRLVSCSILGFGSGFVIKSAGLNLPRFRQPLGCLLSCRRASLCPALCH